MAVRLPQTWLYPSEGFPKQKSVSSACAFSTAVSDLLQVNQELGEIGGVFVSKQPSDTDMGAKAPRRVLFASQLWGLSGDSLSHGFPSPRLRTVLLKGIFYGKVVNA